MKKTLGLILLAAILLSMLSACGQTAVSTNSGESSKQTESENPDKSTSPDSTSQESSKDTDDSAAVNPGGIYKEKGLELTSYLDAFTNSEALFDEPLSKLSDMTSIDAQMDRVIVNLAMAVLPQYDILSVENLPKEEGKLILSGSDGVRERSGDEIKFSSKKEYAEDQMNNKKGDKYSEQGTLNVSANTLVLESRTERGGSIIDRTVVEAVILKDGTYLLQYLSVSQSITEGEPPVTTAVFKRFNQKEYSAITADFTGKSDFTYDSIVGKGDLQTYAMAAKYTITGKFTVKDGTASFSK